MTRPIVIIEHNREPIEIARMDGHWLSNPAVTAEIRFEYGRFDDARAAVEDMAADLLAQIAIVAAGENRVELKPNLPYSQGGLVRHDSPGGIVK